MIVIYITDVPIWHEHISFNAPGVTLERSEAPDGAARAS